MAVLFEDKTRFRRSGKYLGVSVVEHITKWYAPDRKRWEENSQTWVEINKFDPEKKIQTQLISFDISSKFNMVESINSIKELIGFLQEAIKEIESNLNVKK